MPIKRITMLKRLLDINNSRHGLVPPNFGKPSIDKPLEKTKLSFNELACQNISPHHIASFLEELSSEESLNLHNLIIAKDEKILFKAYFGANREGVWKSTFSACKSVVSIAIGMLVDEGKLTLDMTLGDIFSNEMRSFLMARTKNITVYDLLTMKTGITVLEETGAMNESELFKAYLSTPPSYEHGKRFFYNSTNTYMLSCIIKKMSGASLTDYLEPRLFSPLGIKDYYWTKSAEGIEFGGWGLYIEPCDFAKIGLMLINGGVWQGKRIISEKYVKNATKKHVTVTDSECTFDYGLHMWVNNEEDQFLFNGMLGQNVWGFKKNGIVIVSNAGNDELFQHSRFFEIVNKYFNREFTEPLKNRFRDSRHLKRVVKRIEGVNGFRPCSCLEKLRHRFAHLPKECYELSDKTYVSNDKRMPTVGLLPLVWQVVENNYISGFKAIKFKIIDGKYYVIYSAQNEEYCFQIGFGRPEYTSLYICNTPFYIGVIGEFTFNEDNEKVFKIRIDFLETPCSIILKFVYHRDYFEVFQKEIPGKNFVYNRVMSIKKGIAQTPIIGGISDLAPDDIIEHQIEKMLEFKFKLREKK